MDINNIVKSLQDISNNDMRNIIGTIKDDASRLHNDGRLFTSEKMYCIVDILEALNSKLQLAIDDLRKNQEE